MEAPMLGVNSTVLQQAFNVVEEPVDEVSASRGSLGFVKAGTQVEVTLRFWEAADPHA